MKCVRSKGLFLGIVFLISTLSFYQPVLAEQNHESIKTIYEGQSQSFVLNVNRNGQYVLEIEYFPVKGNTASPEADIKVIGDKNEWNQHMEFPRTWQDIRSGNRFNTDYRGNEIVPDQKEIESWQTIRSGFSGEEGRNPVNLNAGEYAIHLKMTREVMRVRSVKLVQWNLKSYTEYISENATKKNNVKESIVIEAETPTYKSHSSITASFDRSSPEVQPNDPSKILLNIIGGNSFSHAGQWIEWPFYVENSGLYNMNMHYTQDSLRGLGVGRRIYIDGKVPYEELENVRFPYSLNYASYTLKNNNDALCIYLDQGKHTLRMEVNSSHLEQSVLRLKEIILGCNDTYRKIIGITGSSPDPYRDYNLDKEIPNLTDSLKSQRLQLKKTAVDIDRQSNVDGGSETSVIYEMIRLLDDFIIEPYKIQNRINNYKGQIDALAELMLKLDTQPLTLDYIAFIPEGQKAINHNEGFLRWLTFRAKVFFQSFLNDYTVVGTKLNQKPLKVWINTGELLVSGTASGRDQMQIIKRICDDKFTAAKGISVEMSLVSTGTTLMQAIIAGKGPDVALFVPEQTVANLAIRGALADMRQMKNFEQRKKEFFSSAFVAYRFGNGIFAMPETQNYNMMFYRKDIFDQERLTPPDTWDEFYSVLQRLQEKQLQVGIPESQDIFEMLLLQNGGSVYNDSFSATQLDQQESIQAFKDWTDLYTKHSIPLSYNFFNRFRTGEMPLGLASYTTYNMLVAAAPEISGLWNMAPIPTTVKEGQKIRSQSSIVNGCIIIAKSSHIEDAYNFVDWWTSASTQAAFGKQSEVLLGTSARYNTANKIAFEDLNWSRNEQTILLSGWEHVGDVEQTAATYYVNRSLTNAFRRVVYNYENPRDVLNRYSSDINRELNRKHRQLSSK